MRLPHPSARPRAACVRGADWLGLTSSAPSDDLGSGFLDDDPWVVAALVPSLASYRRIDKRNAHYPPVSGPCAVLFQLFITYEQVLRYQLPSDGLHPHQAGVVPGYTARCCTTRGDSHVAHVACSSRNTNSPATATWPSVQTSNSVFEHIRGLAVRLRQCLITASASVPSQSTSTWPFRRSSYYPLLFPPRPDRILPFHSSSVCNLFPLRRTGFKNKALVCFHRENIELSHPFLRLPSSVLTRLSLIHTRTLIPTAGRFLFLSSNDSPDRSTREELSNYQHHQKWLPYHSSPP